MIIKPLIFAALLASASAYGTITMVATSVEGTTVRLFLEACKTPVIDGIKPEYHSLFREASVTVKNVTYKACWHAPDGNDVVIVMETGDAAAIPKEAFVPEEGV
jgi:hypothetical protein